jgi:RimJ/RimL family protein N-acetyltransferase
MTKATPSATKLTLKNGSQILVRRLDEKDAPAFHHFCQELFSSTDFVVTTPEEFQRRSVAETRQRLQSHVESFCLNFAAFPAEEPHKIVGNIELSSSARWKMQHVGWIGMGILSTFRGLGLGEALFRHLLRHPDLFPQIERMELEVLTRNQVALALYQKMGFVTEGLRRKAYRQKDGRFDDSLMMSLLREEFPRNL